MVNLLSSWHSLLALLKAQLTGAPKITIEATRQRIRKLYEQAQVQNVRLSQPDYQDPIFDGMTLGSSTVAAAFDLATEEAKRISRLGRHLDSQRKYMAKLRKGAEAAGRQFKPHRPYQKRGGVHRCACGCGMLVLGRWGHGHHWNWIWLMRLIERGLITPEQLPPEVQMRTVWVTCKECKGLMPKHGIDGLVLVPRIGYSCRIWLRRLKRLKLPNSSRLQVFRDRIIRRAIQKSGDRWAAWINGKNWMDTNEWKKKGLLKWNAHPTAALNLKGKRPWERKP